jgi:hypothetical protein
VDGVAPFATLLEEIKMTRRIATLVAAVVLLFGGATLATTASARDSFSVSIGAPGFGFGYSNYGYGYGYVGPPVAYSAPYYGYYAPPAYYAPPRVVYRPYYGYYRPYGYYRHW